METYQRHPLCELRFWHGETGQQKKRRPWIVLAHREEDLLLELLGKVRPLQDAREGRE